MQSRYLRRRLCSVTVLARCERTPCFYAGYNRCLRRSAARVQTLYHLRRRLCPVAVLARCEIDATLSCWRQPLLAMLRCTCAVTISGSGFAPPPRSLATCCRHASMLASTTAPGAVLHVCSHHLRRRLRSVAVCSLDASCATRSCWRQPLLWWLSALFCNYTSNLDAVAALMLRASRACCRMMKRSISATAFSLDAVATLMSVRRLSRLAYVAVAQLSMCLLDVLARDASCAMLQYGR